MAKQLRTKRIEKPVPTIDRAWDEYRFVWMSLRYKLMPWCRVSRRKISQIYRLLLNFLAAVAETSDIYARCKDALDETWPVMATKMRKNPALAQFMLEYGVHSEFFYPFLLRVPQATTLEVASGYAYDLLGNLRRIPVNDPMYAFVQGDEMFEWIRMRIEGEQAYLKGYEDVLFVGGGLLQALRRNNYPLGDLRQRIIAYDFNLDLQEPLLEVFDRPLSEYGIEYHFEPAENAKKDFAPQSFDVIDVSGVLSYRKNDKELRSMLGWLLDLLKTDGVLVFDLQVLTLTLLFDKLVLGWETDPAMKPEKNTQDAIKKVTQICEELGVGVEVMNSTEIGVQFAVRKRML